MSKRFPFHLSHRSATLLSLGVLGAASALVVACDAAPPEPSASKGWVASTRATVAPVQQDKASRKVAGRPAAQVKVSEDDPLKGQWNLAQATEGLPPSGTLTATIVTDLGNLECKLYEERAPITVANFVGLARGNRPWKTPEGSWEKKPAYDGTIFHRVIQGFMIQGGDAKKNGSGEAGYVIPDEIWENGTHDRAGLLCMANRGPNTNSAQFFITDAAAPHLDGNYTIFGECAPEATVHAIAALPTTGDRPNAPPTIKSVTIARK